jgi:hypothetical protein
MKDHHHHHVYTCIYFGKESHTNQLSNNEPRAATTNTAAAELFNDLFFRYRDMMPIVSTG